MSRIGKKPILKPENVEVTVEAGNQVTVKGPKGQLTKQLPHCLQIKLEEGLVSVLRPSDKKEHRAMHGLGRTLLANMVEGVTRFLQKTGTGWRRIPRRQAGKSVSIKRGLFTTGAF
mgnify:CR=1 FL=1